MKKNILLIFAFGLSLSGLSQAGEHVKPTLSKTYEEMYQAVWNKAGEGELPVYECARVIGTASKMLTDNKDQNNEAQQAYKACYVDAILHYSDAFFELRDNSTIDRDSKPNGCPLYSRYLTAHVVSLDTYAERFNLTAEELNKQINERLGEAASLCQVALD